jgi:hypothetical protein
MSITGSSSGEAWKNAWSVITAASQVANLFPWLGWQLVGRLILHAEAVEAVLLGKAQEG